MLRIALTGLIIGLAATSHAAIPAPDEIGEEQVEQTELANRERALDVVVDDARFAAIRKQHPAVSTNVAFSDQYECWFVEFLVESREIGFATVAPDGSRILEFSLETDDLELREALERAVVPGGTDDDRVGDLDDREREEAGRSFLRRLHPYFEGPALFWLALVVTALVAADFRRPFSLRNLDLLSLLAIAPFLIGLWENQRAGFTTIYAITIYLFARMIVEVWRRRFPELSINLPPGALIFLLVLLYGYHVLYIRAHGVDDAGIWATFGAQHMMQEGTWPYGHYDDGDTYGPALYALHIPFVAAIPPMYTKGGETFPLRPGAFAEGVAYESMHFAAVKFTAALFDALILVSLILIGRRIERPEVGLGAAVLYAASPYVIGGTGGGLGWISHIFPTAATVFALLWIRRPVVSGLLLAIGAWALYYPAFLLPLWAGFHWGRWRRMAWFVGTVGLVSLAIVGLLIWKIDAGEEPLGALAKIRLFLENTVGFQARPSWFGFWAQHPQLQSLQPVVKILYGLFCLALFFLPRRKRVRDVVALSAAVIIGTQLWKPHGSGTYISWYMPFLILAYLAGGELEHLDDPHVRAGP
jgi:hypothetical protein